MFKKIRELIKEHKELKYLAYHDSLTQLLNRNWLYKHLHFIKTKYVYFIDINNLHEINKNGHIAGDIHIQSVVNGITLSDNDLFIRYAGDEFLLFTDKNDAVSTNDIVAVGCCEIKEDICEAIHLADVRMLHSKLLLKQNH